MTQKLKSLYSITIDGCYFNTRLRYNTNTDHISIGTVYQYRKAYIDLHKTESKAYYQSHKTERKNKRKQYYEDNKDKIKERDKQHYEKTRDSNTPRLGSEEYRIKCSCTKQGIPREEFNGFAKNSPYCEKFDNDCRESNRIKYNNCDYISGIHKDICSPNRELSVHHVDYNKQQGCDDHEWKLIPLCLSNHIKTNTNRSFWNRLFTYSLQYEKRIL